MVTLQRKMVTLGAGNGYTSRGNGYTLAENGYTWSV